MSKLHIIFKLRIDLYDRNGTLLDKIAIPFPTNSDQYPIVAPNAVKKGINMQELEECVMGDLQIYTLQGVWNNRVFTDPKINHVASGFNDNDNRYHMWVQHSDGENIRSAQLARAVHFANPEVGDWYDDCNLLDSSDLKSLKLKSVKLIPEIERILLVTEHEVKLHKLAPYQTSE
jgi:hypothetical protein